MATISIAARISSIGGKVGAILMFLSMGSFLYGKVAPAGVSFTPAFFAGMTAGKLALRPLLDAAIPAGLVSAEFHPGQWEDVGTPQRLAALDAALREARVP